MNHKKKKCKWRHSLSIVLSAALMFSAVPVAGARASEAAQPSMPAAHAEGTGEADATPSESSAFGVKYIVEENENGSEYVSITGLAEDFLDYVDDEGAYAFPKEINGVLVEALKCGYTILPDEVKKITLPDGLYDWDSCHLLGNNLQEVHILYLGDMTNEAGLDISSTSSLIYTCDYGDDGSTLIGCKDKMDIYLYSSKLESAAYIVSIYASWADLADIEDYMCTVHVRNDDVAAKFGERSFKKKVQGKCTAVVDVEVTLFQELQYDLYRAKRLKEEDYTKGSWVGFKAAIEAAENVSEDAGGSAITQAKEGLTAAKDALVSLTELRAALAQASEKEKDIYTKSSWTALEEAVAAAGEIADDISVEDLAVITKAVTDALSGLEELKASTLVITCADVQAPARPDPQVTENTSGGEVTFEYSETKGFEHPLDYIPWNNYSHYVRARSARTDEYAAAVSEPVKFTITSAEPQGEGYSLDEATGVLTITDSDMIENSKVIGEMPWLTLRKKVKSVKFQFPEGSKLTKIGAYAFYGMNEIETMELPAGIEEVGAYAFADCEKWADVIAMEGITAGEGAFQNCASLEGTVTLADDMKTIPDSLFADCGKLNGGAEDYPLPSQAERIGKNSFQGTGIRTYRMPVQLKEIGEEAFKASGVTVFAVPKSVELIEKHSFKDCAKLEYLEFENNNYTEENLKLVEQKWFSGGREYKTEETLEGLPLDAVVLCDGATYDLLAPHAGYYVIQYSGKTISVGWPASILRHTGEYVGGFLEEIRTEIDSVAVLNQADYSPEAWEALQTALAEAEERLGQGESNYEKRKNSTAAREILATGIRACLDSLYANTKAMSESQQVQEDYDQEADSWVDLEDAMTDAEILLRAESPTPEELLDAIATLKRTAGNLDYSPLGAAKAALDAAIAGPAGKNEADYTPESWKAYQDAVKEAEEIRKTGNQQQMEAAAEKVSQAEKALVRKDSQTAAPTLDPTKAPDTSTSPAPGNTNASPSPSPSVQPGASQTPKLDASAKPGSQGGTQNNKPAVKVKKATVKMAKSSKKKTLLVQWKKISGVTGYQVQLARNKKFTKGKKTYTVKKAKVTKKTVKKLKRKKTYYVRVRGYRTVNGKKYYGGWSKYKKAKVK